MLGLAVQHALAEQKLPVLQLVRHGLTAGNQFFWNPTAAPAIPHLDSLEGIYAAVHLSGANLAAHRWTRAYRRELTSSRVGTTHALASALARLRRPPQVLLTASAVGIYGHRGNDVLDETSTAGSGFLADLCQQWEEATKPASDAGIRVIHLRFGVVIGAGAGALSRMMPIFRAGFGGPIGFGRRWMSWISLADAAGAILFAAQTPGLSGAVNLTSPNPVTNGQFTRALGHALHCPTLVPVPPLALRLVFGQMAREALLASTRACPAKLTAAGFEFTCPTIEQALAAALIPAPSPPPARTQQMS